MGTLQYIDSGMTPIRVDIAGTVDKGPFLSCDQEWTCYRRNYLACVCSYSLSPQWYPNVPIQFTPAAASSTSTTPGQQQTYQVYGFAMCISAMVAENEHQNIELVQHTPKRDKGPITKPNKIPMAPKMSSASHQLMNPYGDGSTMPGTRASLYSDGLGGPQGGGQQLLPAEHTFERIQFKHATLNNGKRRAAQQYYHLIVELWADVGAHCPDQYVKVAYRKSAKMIVRGRSPGHYQNERRGSQGNGPGGSAGNMGMGHMGDFNSSAAMIGGTAAATAGTGGYATTPYDGRGSVYGGGGGGGAGVRQHDLHADEALSPADDGKMAGLVDGSPAKRYQYYPGPVYNGHHESQHAGQYAQQRLDMFGGHRSGPEAVASGMAPDTKIKSEYDFCTLPRPLGSNGTSSHHHQQAAAAAAATTPRVADQRQHEHFDGKPASGGYYPSLLSSSGIHMAMA